MMGFSARGSRNVFKAGCDCLTPTGSSLRVIVCFYSFSVNAFTFYSVAHILSN
jgi:hypothetical protein